MMTALQHVQSFWKLITVFMSQRISPELLEDDVYDLLADGVMAPGVVIGSVLLSCDQLFRVEEAPTSRQ
jgi:hypothetical protein